jgi:hypothetical protein
VRLGRAALRLLEPHGNGPSRHPRRRGSLVVVRGLGVSHCEPFRAQLKTYGRSRLMNAPPDESAFTGGSDPAGREGQSPPQDSRRYEPPSRTEALDLKKVSGSSQTSSPSSQCVARTPSRWSAIARRQRRIALAARCRSTSPGGNQSYLHAGRGVPRLRHEDTPAFPRVDARLWRHGPALTAVRPARGPA